MYKSSLFIITSVATLSACDAFNVKEGNTDIGGIPFFSHAVAVKQETIYAREWVEATVKLEKLDVKREVIPNTETTLMWRLALPTFNRPSLEAAIASSLTEAIEPTDFKSALDTKLQTMCNQSPKQNCTISEAAFRDQVKPVELPKNAILSERIIKNKVEYSSYIDYTKKYYIMPEYPFFGSGTSELVLNDNGTLGTAKSSGDTTKLAEFIPGKEYLAKRWGVKDLITATSAAAFKPPVMKPTVDIVINGYAYTLSKLFKPDTGKNKGIETDLNRDPLCFAPRSGTQDKCTKHSISVSEYKKSNSSSRSENDKNKISINGSISLPDALAK